MEFNEHARDIIENRDIELRLCPDQYVGIIREFSSESNDFPVRTPAEIRPENLNCLIMILESPHKAEFIVDLPSPANGSTGRLIRQHILTVMGLSNYENYGLLLMNAIQNQCSVGHPTCFYRDEIFMSVWNDGRNVEFVDRLNELYSDGDVIVNCCTKGKGRGPTELRQLVQSSIPIDERIVLRRTHPSSWYSERNRNSEWALA